MKKIAIIGGGMAGLGAAYELVKSGLSDITIFEKSPKLGGLMGTVKISGSQLEVFYHHMFPTYRDFIEVSGELGIKDKMFFRRAKSAILYNGEILPFDSPFDLLRFHPLSLWERLRTGLVLIGLKLARSQKRFERISADEWSRLNFGEKAHSILWEPLLVSKFGDFSKKVGMAWFWGRIYERPSRFGYFNGSFSVFTDAVEKHLKGKGVKFFLGKTVEEIGKNKAGGFVVKTPGSAEIFDQVIIASAPASFIESASRLVPPDFARRLEELKYLGAICAILVLKRHLTDFYWLNINDKDFPFLGVIEQSNFVSPENYGGYHPVYLSKYLDAESDFYKLSDEEIWSRYLPALKRVNPQFSEDWVLEKHIFRSSSAQPVITADYDKIRPPYQTPVNGLWWVSMSHVYPWDRGIDHAFHSGRELAKEMLSAQR